MMRIVLLLFIITCGNVSAQSSFPTNPFKDVVAVHYADSMTRAKLQGIEHWKKNAKKWRGQRISWH
jgi:hypothetical protein